MTAMTPEIEKIVARIEKLLRLASNNPNENEASLAAEKAQELLEAYNLDMTTVGNANAVREDRKLAGGLYKWQRSLWQQIAQNNFCYYWSDKGLEKGSKYEHRIVGSKVNVLSTRLMAEYLQDAIERITREEYDNDSKLYFKKAAVAFREGMADRIIDRLITRRWEREQEARREAAEAARKAQESGQAVSVSLTISDVREREREANDDFLYGEGYTARWKKYAAEARERRERQEQAAKDADALLFAQDPEEFERRKAEEAKRREREEKREERNRKRRKGRYYAPKGPRHSDFWNGYEKGAEVSLDSQVKEGAATRRLNS